MHLAIWQIILLVGISTVVLSSVLMVGGVAVSQRVNPTDDPGATRAPMINVDTYPLISQPPIAYYLESSSVPTRNLE
jgi:hypothetical protein